MYKKIFSVFVSLLFLSLNFTFAVQGNPQGNMAGSGDDQLIGGDRDEYGCLISAGYSWNEEEQQCVREWETGEARYQKEVQTQTRTQIQEGTHINKEGQTIKIQTRANNRIRLEVDGVSAECSCEMKQEKFQNETRLYTQLSNGKNAEIKIMPNVASEKALEQLRLRVCTEEKGCSIELKEVGKNQEEKQLAYEIQIQRHSRILGIFQKKMQVQAQISAENGELIRVKKPWWAFIAVEPAE